MHRLLANPLIINRFFPDSKTVGVLVVEMPEIGAQPNLPPNSSVGRETEDREHLVTKFHFAA